MKTPGELIAVLLLAGLAGNTWAQGTARGEILYLPFDAPAKGSWSKVTDAGANGNHGAVVGTVSYEEDRFGIGCSAMVFDGASYVRIPNSKSLSSPTDAITISVWFYLDAASDPYNQWLAICCKGSDPMETWDCPQYRMHATAQTLSVNTEFTRLVAPAIATEIWYHYVFTFDGSEFRAYLDGEVIHREYHPLTLTANDMDLEIGRDVPGKMEFFQGRMDDLRIYARALSAGEVDDLYTDRSGASAADRCRGSRAKKDPSPPSAATPARPVDPAPPVAVTPPTTVAPTKPSPAPPPADPVPAAPRLAPDTVIVYRDLLPDTLEGIPVSYQHDVTVASREVEIYLFDGEEEDGDTVSVAINGVWVKEDFGLRLKNKVPPKGSVIKCVLFPGKNNYLVSKACNLGKKGLNTLSMTINDGKRTQVLTINSKIGDSGAIRIDCME